MTDIANGGTARWQLWVSIGGAAFVLLSAISGLAFTAISAKQEVEELAARVMAVEELARADRAKLSAMDYKLVEVETQFRASDQIRNLMHANEMRNTAMLWSKAFGVTFPIDNAYYPTIAQERVAP